MLTISTWKLSARTRCFRLASKPPITDSVTTSAATPIITPTALSSVVTEMKASLRRARRYRSAMRSSYLTMRWLRIVVRRIQRRHLDRPHSEYHVFLRQQLDFFGAEAEHPAKDLVIVLTEDGRGAAKFARRAAES